MSFRRFQAGGPVGIFPSAALASASAGGFSPRINFNIRGESIRGIMSEVNKGLVEQLNDMMMGTGKTGRYDDLARL
jgi:hypothetical protein